MINNIGILILYIFILFLPLGELIRIDIGNSIVLKPMDFLAILVAAITLIRYLSSTKLFQKTELILPIFAFLGSCLLSLVLNIPLLSNIEYVVSFLYLIRLISYISLFFIIKTFSEQEKSKIKLFLIAINIILLAIGFVQFAYYTNLINLSYLGWDPHWLRLYATFFDPNFAGVYLDIFFLFILDIFLSKKINKHAFALNILIISILLITLAGILLTFSRSAFIALISGFIIYTFFLRINKKRIVLFILIFLVGIGLILKNSKLTEGTKLFRTISSIERVQSYKDGFYIFSKEPIFGVGFNAYRYAQLRYKTAFIANWKTSHSNAGLDNSFIFILGTTGIVGFCTFLWLLWKIFKKTKHNPLIGALVTCVCIGSFFINAFFYPEIMALLWIILGLTD